ncbi:MAG: tetratricopeptide repeat protein [Gemmatimonadaceae bacterium]|nr:tetratricopeptide repeat protein [Gemmatimonadaceae bacterium]
MAQAPRTAGSSASLSDDPIESFTNWLQMNSKPIAMVLGGAAIAAAAIFVYRSTTASTREKASAALYTAQQPFVEGKFTEAESALSKVVDRFGSTASGQQAVLMLAQVQYEQKKYDDGIKGLEKALGSASADFKPSINAMIASGYELKGDFAKAAEAYGKAADATSFPTEKQTFQASQARSLMAAGKGAEAKTIWEALAQLEGSQAQQEAQVRLGELAGKQP